MEVLTSEKAADDHVLRIDLYDPAGEWRREYSQNVVSTGGRYESKIPIALNDKEGEWVLRIRDVISGITREVKFICNPPKVTTSSWR